VPSHREWMHGVVIKYFWVAIIPYSEMLLEEGG
jgi:hypothetical protein